MDLISIKKMMLDLMYVRKRIPATDSDQIKAHSVLSRVIDYLNALLKEGEAHE